MILKVRVQKQQVEFGFSLHEEDTLSSDVELPLIIDLISFTT